jgi:putative DNA primase/helicase
VEHYARIVKEKAILRNIAHAGDSMTAAALSGDLEIALARVESAALLTRSLQDVRPTRIVSGKELLQMDVEPREYIIDGLLPCRSMAEIFSWRGVGKTYFALTLADAASSAKKFLHWEVTKPRRVLFVDGELDAATLQQRLKGLGAGTDNLKLLCCDMQDDPFPNLATIRAQNMIEDALGDVQLLILDNLSALAPSSNESEGEDWIAIQTWLLDLRRRGIATIFLHHAGHSGWSRGTTRREDLLDLVIELRRPKDYVATEGLRLELHFTKTRGLLGLGAEPIEARLETDLDGKLIWATRNLEDLREKQILDLRASGSSIREIAEATGIPRSTVDRILNTSRRAT